MKPALHNFGKVGISHVQSMNTSFLIITVYLTLFLIDKNVFIPQNKKRITHSIFSHHNQRPAVMHQWQDGKNWFRLSRYFSFFHLFYDPIFFSQESLLLFIYFTNQVFKANRNLSFYVETDLQVIEIIQHCTQCW